MEGNEVIALVIAGALFIISTFLAVAEVAFVRMSPTKLHSMPQNKKVKKLGKMLESPEATLNTILFLTLFAQLGTVNALGYVLHGKGGWIGVVGGLLLEVVLFFVVGEVAPKTFAVQNTEKAALFVTRPLWFLTNFLPLKLVSRSLIGLGNIVLPGKGLKKGPFVTEQDLRILADLAAKEDSIDQEDKELIHSIFEFGDTLVREAMTPRTEITAVSHETSLDDALDLAIAKGFSRLPAYEDSLDNIKGIIYVKDLIVATKNNSKLSLVKHTRDAVHIPEQKFVAEVLADMQKGLFHMAIVVDEYGGTAGLITLEDVIEEIVGDISDEYDEYLPQIEKIDKLTFKVPGRTPIGDLSDAVDDELPDSEWDTVSGLVFNLLGHVPVLGEKIELGKWSFEVEELDAQRIVSVIVTKDPTFKDPESDDDDDDEDDKDDKKDENNEIVDESSESKG